MATVLAIPRSFADLLGDLDNTRERRGCVYIHALGRELTDDENAEIDNLDRREFALELERDGVIRAALGVSRGRLLASLS